MRVPLLVLAAIVIGEAISAGGGNPPQTFPFNPSLIGDVARGLSAEDRAEIRRVLGGDASGTWLLIGPRGQVSAVRFIRAHLAPDVESRDLRRGPLVDLVHDTAGVIRRPGVPPEELESVPPAWFVLTRSRYAQVALDGRAFDEIRGDQDLNRPFETVGSIADEELVELVRFIRTSPPNTHSRRGAPIPTVRGDWPIVQVKLDVEMPLVRLRRDDNSWHDVRLRREGSAWVVASISLVMA